MSAPGRPPVNITKKRFRRAYDDLGKPALTTSDVADYFDVSLPTASKYLSRLEDQGAIQCYQVGNAKAYAPTPPVPRLSPVKHLSLAFVILITGVIALTFFGPKEVLIGFFIFGVFWAGYGTARAVDWVGVHELRRRLALALWEGA